VLATGAVNSLAAVVRVDPTDGSQTLLTEASDLLATAVGLGVDPGGGLVVAADGRGLCECVALIDLASGAITGGSLAILVDGQPQGTAVASDVGIGPDGEIWLLAYASDPVGSGLFRWDVRPRVEPDGAPFLPMASDPLGDVQPVLGICGDGELGLNEECDDANGEAGDGCDPNCTLTACGNGVTTAGEDCDDGDGRAGDGCDPNCTTSRCGNGIVAEDEACDDADDVDDNGCNRSCQVDFGPQTKRQRRCINGVNQGIDRLARARAKIVERCLAAAGRGRLGHESGALDACMDSDPRGTSARALRDLEERERLACIPGHLPELALSEERLAGASAADRAPAQLARDLLGIPAQVAQTQERAGECQKVVLRRTNDLFEEVWSELREAKASKLAGRGSLPAVSDAQLAAHVSQAAAGSRAIAKAQFALRDHAYGDCFGVRIATVFPGCDAEDPGTLATCAQQAARCRSCLLLAEADPGVRIDCDDFDDDVPGNCPTVR
jgi:cysteine-rich repeat protein